MYKILLVLLLGLFINNCVAQKRYLIAENRLGKKIAFEENKRVRVNSHFGKLRGKLGIIDDSTILVGSRILPLDVLMGIKRNPLGMTLPISIILGYYGLTTLAAATLFAIIYDAPVIFAYAIVPIAGMTYGTIRPPNILPSYKRVKGWTYHIISQKQ